MSAFSHTAEIAYFIEGDHTGKGFGKSLHEFLEKETRDEGIATILANISPLNAGRIIFDNFNGFSKYGCFKKVGKRMENYLIL